jgi:hypothetical protein
LVAAQKEDCHASIRDQPDHGTQTPNAHYGFGSLGEFLRGVQQDWMVKLRL